MNSLRPERFTGQEGPKDSIGSELRVRGPEICRLPAAAGAPRRRKGFWAGSLGLQIHTCQGPRPRSLRLSFHCASSGPRVCEVSQMPPMRPRLPVPPALPLKSSLSASESSPDPAHLSAPFGRGIYRQRKNTFANPAWRYVGDVD